MGAPELLFGVIAFVLGLAIPGAVITGAVLLARRSARQQRRIADLEARAFRLEHPQDPDAAP